jgi:hypothetical protein
MLGRLITMISGDLRRRPDRHLAAVSNQSELPSAGQAEALVSFAEAVKRCRSTTASRVIAGALLLAGSLWLPGTAAGSSWSFRIVSATIDTSWRDYNASSGCTMAVTATQHDTLAPGGLGAHVSPLAIDIRPNVKSTSRASYLVDCPADGPLASTQCSGEQSHPAQPAAISGALTKSRRFYRVGAGDYLFPTTVACSDGQSLSVPRPNFGEPGLKTTVQSALIPAGQISTGGVPRSTVHLSGHLLQRGLAGDVLRYEIALDWKVVLRRVATGTGGRR